jgi:ABC-type branched-subunit amino acid transport system ATPase component
LALLEVKNLVVHYGKALALEGVSLAVEPGVLVGVLGPNGAGKTTLLKAISRTVPPSAGHISFNGASLDGLPAHKVVGHGICHCPEGRRLFLELSLVGPTFTVADLNVASVLSWARMGGVDLAGFPHVDHGVRWRCPALRPPPLARTIRRRWPASLASCGSDRPK